MGKIFKYISSFLESENETSSRRLIFLGSAFQLCLMVAGILAYFLYKKEYEFALQTLESFGIFVMVAGGFVTIDALKRKKKDD